MEKIAFISGGTFIYWSSVILALAALAAIALFAALYLKKDGDTLALCVTIPVAVLLSIVLSRLVHWYCRADAYESFQAALTDYSWGGYALMGTFAACILTACVLRLARVVKNLPRMLDCMALAGGAGIAVGRLASMFNASDRGMIVADTIGLPFAFPVTNTVSGVVENRLATFMIQAIVTGVIVLALLLYMGWCRWRKRELIDGDISLMFLAAYGSCQIVCDSTRYDSLFMRSNGFVSIVQILGLIALVTAIVLFSVRMVKHNGLKKYYFAIWAAMLGLMGAAGYMEYYVQRHGNEAAFAYSVMSSSLIATVLLTLTVRYLSIRPKKEAPAAETEAPAAEAETPENA